MKPPNLALLFGGLFGFLAIAMGAYADHVLRPELAVQSFETLTTALRYQLIHAVLLTTLGLIDRKAMTRRAAVLLNCIMACFIIGTLLFCVSLATHSIWDNAWIVRLAPIGGMALMAGWLGLAAMAFLKLRRDGG